MLSKIHRLFLAGHLVALLAAWSFSARVALGESPATAPKEFKSTLDIIDQFTAPGIPKFGPAERPVDPPTWKASPEMKAAHYPGAGLAEHPMLYIGEGDNTMYVVKDGKIIWTYATGKGWEFDDIWLLSNGNILFSRMAYAEEITPQKKVVWHLDAPAGTEIHTLQPLGLDKVMLVENGLPPKLLIINITNHTTESERPLPALSTTDRKTVHGQFRRFRVTAAGTYLASFLTLGKVVEYDQNLREIWSYNIPSPWAAIRLQNGNTLITDEKDALTREVNSKGETVWEYKLSELPAELHFDGSQSCVRLRNGNTILCSRGDGGKGCQLVEITRDKKLVWALYDWDHFGPASAIQILDEPGFPENPGDLQR